MENGDSANGNIDESNQLSVFSDVAATTLHGAHVAAVTSVLNPSFRTIGRNECRKPECTSWARNGSKYCVKHGGGKKCSIPECTGIVYRQGKCRSHCGSRCRVPGCNTFARVKDGNCRKHGSGPQCSVYGCRGCPAKGKDKCKRHERFFNDRGVEMPEESPFRPPPLSFPPYPSLMPNMTGQMGAYGGEIVPPSPVPHQALQMSLPSFPLDRFLPAPPPTPFPAPSEIASAYIQNFQEGIKHTGEPQHTPHNVSQLLDFLGHSLHCKPRKRGRPSKEETFAIDALNSLRGGRESDAVRPSMTELVPVSVPGEKTPPIYPYAALAYLEGHSSV